METLVELMYRFSPDLVKYTIIYLIASGIFFIFSGAILYNSLAKRIEEDFNGNHSLYNKLSNLDKDVYNSIISSSGIHIIGVWGIIIAVIVLLASVGNIFWAVIYQFVLLVFEPVVIFYSAKNEKDRSPVFLFSHLFLSIVQVGTYSLFVGIYFWRMYLLAFELFKSLH